MARISVICFLILFGSGSGRNTKEVSCALGTDCILPCFFKTYHVIIIHWKNLVTETNVHSYYNGQNQNQDQNEDYRGRTALFEEKIKSGDASLLLSGVRFQDEGEYMCLTASTDISVTFITLSVFANIDEVDLRREGDALVCSSQGIYSRPQLEWSHEQPYSEPDVEKNDELYSISSSVLVPFAKGVTSCRVWTRHSSKQALIKEEFLGAYNNEALLSCFDIKAQIKSVVWKFNQSSTIVSRSGSDMVFNETWGQFVDALTESGRLVLKDLTTDQEGLYSCHIISEDMETFVTVTQLEIQMKSELDRSTIQEIQRELDLLLFSVLLALTVGVSIIFGLLLFTKDYETLQWIRNRFHKNEKIPVNLQGQCPSQSETNK